MTTSATTLDRMDLLEALLYCFGTTWTEQYVGTDNEGDSK